MVPRDNNTMHTEPRAARVFLLACRSPRPGERCRYHAHGEPMPHCPLCQISMRIVTRSETELDVCDSCRGVWLDPHEFASLPKLKNSLSDQPSSVSDWNFKCPGCSCRDFELAKSAVGDVYCCSDCSGVFVPRDIIRPQGAAKEINDGDVNWFKDV